MAEPQYTSLLHLPSGRPARPLAGTLPYGVRTFLKGPEHVETFAIIQLTLCKSLTEKRESLKRFFSLLSYACSLTIKCFSLTPCAQQSIFNSESSGGYKVVIGARLHTMQSVINDQKGLLNTYLKTIN